MNRLLLAIGLLALLFIDPVTAQDSDLGEPYFETVPGSPELANGIVTSLAQDQRGLIWFGTPEGLYSFDGYRVREFRQQDGKASTLADDYVRALMARPDGSLWVATQGAGISIYRPELDHFEQLRHQPDNPNTPSSNAPVAMVQQPDGIVWIGYGTSGLDRYDPARRQFEHFRQPELAHNTVRSLLLDRRGDLWLGTGNGLQRRRAGQREFEAIASTSGAADSLAGLYIYALFEASDGRIWIGTQAHGAAVLDPTTLELTRIPPGEGPTQVSHAWIDGFVEPWPGRIWLASFGAGIDVMNSQTGRIEQRLRSDPAIPGSVAMDRVLMPMRDRSGLIWLGTWGGGLQRHNPSNAKTFRAFRHSPARANSLSHPTIHSMLEIAPGQLWLGTGGNGIDVLDLREGVVGGYRADSKLPGALRDGTVRALAQTQDGQRWVGTQQAGLHRWRAQSNDFEAVRPDLRIRCLLASKNDTLIIGRQDGLSELIPSTGTVQSLSLVTGQAFTEATWSLAEDPSGNLWVGTPNGLFWRRAGEASLQATPISGLGLRAVMDLKFDASGTLWVAGPAALARLKQWHHGEPRFEPYRRVDELPVFGRQILFDQNGWLWSPRQRLNLRDEQADDFGVADGVPPDSVQVGASLALSTGTLVFGGARGLLLVEPKYFQRWEFGAPLIITSASIDGAAKTAQQVSRGLEFLSGGTRVRVEFAALDYSAPELVRYQYRLLGLDQEWIAAESGSRVASYNNLWPGDYTLQVQALGRSGVASPTPLALPVRVHARWWQSWLIPALSLVLIVALVLAINAWRDRRALVREERLRALVAQRTAELSQAKEAAEAALASLQGAQVQLVAAEKMASLGQLVAGVAHEINTPIGIALTAASHLEDVARQGRAQLESGRLSKLALEHWQSQSAEAMRLVRTSLERAAVLVASFKQVSVDQASQQRRQFELASFLGEIVTALQPGLKHRPYRLSVDCPSGIVLDTYPGALFQIVTNLVNNAVAHAFPEERSGQMHLSASQTEGMVELRFSDDGVGMSASVAARAFDPFFTTRRGQGGSGLGLHLVHNLVHQLLGGTIELSSIEGAGTIFLLRIPQHAPAGVSEAMRLR